MKKLIHTNNMIFKEYNMPKSYKKTFRRKESNGRQEKSHKDKR